MSQYGAQGAAKRGLTHTADPGLLLPGHQRCGTTTGTIRVLISADTDNDVRVRPGQRPAGARGRQRHDVRPAHHGRITTWRLRTVSGRTVLEYDDGAWHAYRPGGRTLSR